MTQKLAGISKQDVSDHRQKEFLKLTLVDLMQKQQTPGHLMEPLLPPCKYIYSYVPFAVRN